MAALTDIGEAAGRALAELLRLVGQRHLHHAGDVSGWRLHTDRVRRNEL